MPSRVENSDRQALPDGTDVSAESARRKDCLSTVAQAKIEQRAA